MKRVVLAAVGSCGSLFERMGRRLSAMTAQSGVSSDPLACFFTPNALKINIARQDHLTSLGLDLKGKSVLEVGGGVGLHMELFEKLGCKVLSTDGRDENVAEIRRRYPHRAVRKFDLLDFDSYADIGKHDIVYCYGLLYHTPNPEGILQALSETCKEMILLETCVTPGDHLSQHLTREHDDADQALGYIGCRPTRPWIMDRLRKFWGYAYTTRTQPRHPDFDLDWAVPRSKILHRAVFVGCKHEIINASLVDVLPDLQTNK